MQAEPRNSDQTSDVEKLARGGIVGVIGRVGGQALGVLGNIVVGRLLGPGAYGLYAIGWTIVRMVGVIAPIGLDRGVVYFATRYREHDRPRFVGIVRQAIGLSMISGVLIGGIIYVLAPWIGERVFQDARVITMLRWFAGIFFAYAGLRVVAAATTISQRIKYSVWSRDISQPVVFIVLALGLLALGAGVVGAVGATIASYVAAIVVGLLFLRALYPDLFMLLTPSTGSMGELLRYSIPSAFAGIFAMYMIWVNRLLVGYFLPLEETGVYQAVTQVALLFAMILSSFNLIFTPMSADLFAQQKIARLRELYRVSTKWALYVTIPIFMVVFTFPREVMTVLFGAPYAAGGLALRILTLGQLINILTGPVGSLLVMTGHQRRWSIITGAAFVLNVGLGVLLIPGVGLQGAATAIAVTQTGMFLLGLVQAWRILGGWPYDRRTIKGGLSALGAGLAMALLRVWLSMPVFGHMIVAAMVSVGVFFGLLLLMKLDEEDRQFVDLIKERWMNLRANNGA